MIEVQIPNNVSEYKPKFLLGLTGKQVACVIFTAVAIFLDYRFIKPIAGDFIALFLAAVPAVLAACFGWIEPYGMTFDKYLRSVLLQALIAPQKRKAKMSTSIIVPCDKYYESVPDEELSDEALEHVRYVREKLGCKVDTTDSSLKKKKKVKPKYKKSKQAML